MTRASAQIPRGQGAGRPSCLDGKEGIREGDPYMSVPPIAPVGSGSLPT